MPFDRNKLRQYMNDNGITQDDLALLVGKDVRTIRRWLSPKNRLTPRSIDQICHALDIPAEQFDPDSNGIITSDHNVQVGARVSVAASNGYTLLKKQFGITHKQLIELAPVMFSIIARRAYGLSGRLEQDLAKAEQIFHLTNVDAQIDPLGIHQRNIECARVSEKKGWLFGDEREEENYEWQEEPTNLFCTELNELSKDLQDVSRFSGIAGCPTSIGFQFSTAVIDEITCGETFLKDRIRYGDINLGLMNEHLWHPDNTAERVSWLKREALKSEELRRIKNEAWRKANPEQAKARDAMFKRIEHMKSKLITNVDELPREGGQ